ncbi:protein NUCLEAR FUSION DEFECTIVE 4-like [Dorcoceras hygrometricum]|uniref:Protein NUCLEAR FUSION DEFECTIVE 4-like n=1 Tax=Dorcoceras hygrometricum TaxID=472368 RepID=A0A2Z7AF47_9LAMI|nr:protein NUCLEAR FUSION DEFECTIVE 4-like [Dorcoceras hygrometricum]
MVYFTGRIHLFFHSRWLVLVAAVWMQSWAGTGYMFGSISPVIKSALNYKQRQIASLGVAKDLGGSVGLSAGTLSEILPLWAALLVGVIQNFVGYGWIWLVVTGRAPALPLWAMCILIFVGANGETYFNTAALVSCVQSFPRSRGPVVGVLKGFAGLSGAILTQLYTLVRSPDHASLIFMVVVGPTIVIINLMFIVRPVGVEETLLPETHCGTGDDVQDIINCEIEAEKGNVESPSALERQRLIDQRRTDMSEAAAGGVGRINKRRLQTREDCTLLEALTKANIWLIFCCLLLGSGSGLTVTIIWVR